MAADAWKKYNSFPFRMEGKHIDFVNDTFKVALFTSASNANDPTKTTYGALTNELANGHGYATGGVAVAVTLSQATSTVKWTIANPSWTAAGASLVFRYAVIYDVTTGDVIAWSLLDNAPANITIADGDTKFLQIDAAGVFTTTGM